MITICNGIVRSGSTWSYNVCRGIAGRIAQTVGKQFKYGYQTEAQLEAFLPTEMADDSSVGLVKAHEMGPTALEWLRTGRAKAVCTLRDPRDCVVSDMAFLHGTMEASIKRVQSNLESLPFVQSFGHTLFVRYEEMMANRQWQICRIATHMSVTLSKEMIAEIDGETNIETSKKVCQGLRNLPGEQVYCAGSYLVDYVSLLHENHIGSGKTGRWRDEIQGRDAWKLTEAFEAWLLKLGYETERSIAGMRPGGVHKAGKRALVTAGRGI